MSIVVFYDRNTGDIIKVDPHPEWEEREVRLSYYRTHPEAWPKGAGVLTVPPNIEWNGNPDNWLVRIDSRGHPRLVHRKEAEADREIERAKELALLEMAMRYINHQGAKAKAQKRINELKKGRSIG